MCAGTDATPHATEQKARAAVETSAGTIGSEWVVRVRLFTPCRDGGLVPVDIQVVGIYRPRGILPPGGSKRLRITRGNKGECECGRGFGLSAEGNRGGGVARCVRPAAVARDAGVSGQ